MTLLLSVEGGSQNRNNSEEPLYLVHLSGVIGKFNTTMQALTCPYDMTIELGTRSRNTAVTLLYLARQNLDEEARICLSLSASMRRASSDRRFLTDKINLTKARRSLLAVC